MSINYEEDEKIDILSGQISMEVIDKIVDDNNLTNVLKFKTLAAIAMRLTKAIINGYKKGHGEEFLNQFIEELKDFMQKRNTENNNENK